MPDAATPFPGEACDCHTLGRDAIQDVSLKFRTAAVVSALGLDDVPAGTGVPVVLSGTLADSCEFIATDCLTRVPLGK